MDTLGPVVDGMVGADPVELKGLGVEMVRAADDLERRRRRLSQLVATVNWKGPVADRLRSQFSGIPLGQLADLLRQRGEALREQAREQDQASRASGGGAAGGPAVPGGQPGPGGLSPFTAEALRRAGIDPSTWRPELGFAANRETIQKVYEYYSQLFLDHPELQWAGMAALIGPSFQAGFADLSDMRTAAAKLAGALEAAERLGAALPPGAAENLAGLRALANASDEQLRFFETTLLGMQREIFFDQATQHEAFLNGGVAAIRELDGPEPIDAMTIRAWELVERGRAGDPEALAEGNRLLLLREQKTIIDNDYQSMLNHDPPIGQAMTYLMTATGQPSVPGAGSYADIDPYTFRVSTPGSIGTPDSVFGVDIPNVSVNTPVQLTGTVETPLPAGNIADFDDRWHLIREDTLPAYQELLAEGRVDDILRETSVGDRTEDFRILNRVDDLVEDMATNWDASVGVRFSLP